MLTESFRIMARNIVLISTPIALLLSTDPAKAILNIVILDDGPNLKIEVSGSLSQLGVPLYTIDCGSNGVLDSPDSICTGIDTISPVAAISGPGGFDGIASLFPADSVSGLLFAMGLDSSNTNSVYALDPSYVVGQPFLSSATFNNTSAAAQGFTVPGLVGTWTINGTSESINLFVGQVPGPLPLLGAGAAFGWSRRLRRRIASMLITSQK